MMTKGISALSAAVLCFAFLAGGRAQTRDAGDARLRATLALSRDGILPYEPLSLLVLLRNEAPEPVRVVASWRSFLSVGEAAPGGPRWRHYVGDDEPHVKPPPRTARDFAPGEAQAIPAHIDYEAPSGEHVFARPGRYLLQGTASHDGRFVTPEVEVLVRTPEGIDARAYEFLRRGQLHRYFGEYTIHKYPYGQKTVRELEKFIADFDGSRYSQLARIGLALMWSRGVEGRRDQTRALGLLAEVAEQGGPLSAEAEYHLGAILSREGDNARAGRHFQRVLAGMPPTYFRHLAEASLRQQ